MLIHSECVLADDFRNEMAFLLNDGCYGFGFCMDFRRDLRISLVTSFPLLKLVINDPTIWIGPHGSPHHPSVNEIRLYPKPRKYLSSPLRINKFASFA